MCGAGCEMACTEPSQTKLARSDRDAGTNLESLLATIRKCKLCEKYLPFAPRPILSASGSAKILIIGQAPGMKVQQTGIPWNDPSGDNLRRWMGVSREIFYDTSQIAIMPMGFCYPGKGKSGDLPPRPECARTWHGSLLKFLPNIGLTLLVGSYAVRYYLSEESRDASLTKLVEQAEKFVTKGYFPMVHPSPRNRLWLRKNPWFEAEIIPLLCQEVGTYLKPPNSA